MGPQRSVAAVVAAGFAVIVAVIVVAWVASRPRSEHSPSAPTAAEVGMPSRIDETDVVEVLWTQDDVAAGTDLGAALQDGRIGTVAAPAELVPQDHLSSAASGTITPQALGPGVVLTTGNTTASSTSTTASSAVAPCPKDWSSPLPTGQHLVFVVSAPVAKGTTVAQAFASGSLRPYAVSDKNAPRNASAALAPVCTNVAAFDLTRGTVLTPATFIAA